MVNKREKKIHDLTENLLNAFNQMKIAIQTPIVEERDLGGNIMAFVNVYELFWNYLKEILENEGIGVSTPRQAFEEAFRAKFIQNPEIWVEMMKDRNNIVHSYNRQYANELNERITSKYYPALQDSLRRRGLQVS